MKYLLLTLFAVLIAGTSKGDSPLEKNAVRKVTSQKSIEFRAVKKLGPGVWRFRIKNSTDDEIRLGTMYFGHNRPFTPEFPVFERRTPGGEWEALPVGSGGTGSMSEYDVAPGRSVFFRVFVRPFEKLKQGDVLRVTLEGFRPRELISTPFVWR